MLNQYIAAFQGFFSRAFWFASFLPVALFSFLHLTIAWVCLGDIIPLWSWLAAKPDTLTLFPAVFAAMVVLGAVMVGYMMGVQSLAPPSSPATPGTAKVINLGKPEAGTSEHEGAV